VTGGLGRREFLQAGGLSLAVGGLVAGCGRPRRARRAPPSATAPTSTSLSPAKLNDITVLRTASSLEHFAIGLYGQASSYLRTPALVDMTKYFVAQHLDHAGVFEKSTSDLGGEPFKDANQTVAQTLQDRLTALKTEADVMKLAYDVEAALAATYYAATADLSDPKLSATAVAVGAVEARHVAILGELLSGFPVAFPTIPARSDSPPFAPGGFQTADGAIKPGTGV